MAVAISVNSVDVTSLVKLESLSFSNKGVAGNTGVAKCRIIDSAGTAVINPEHSFLITDGGVTVFLGKIRSRDRTEVGAGSNRKKVYDVTAEDVTSYLVDDVIDGNGLRSTAETDKARIEWLLTTWGTKGVTGGATVQSVGGTISIAQDFTGMNLYEAILEVAKLGGGKFYVDFSLALHYFTTETNPAAVNLSDAPNGTTTFGYWELTMPDDTHDLINAVYVIPGAGVAPLWRPDPATWPTASHTAYGRREATLRDTSLTTQAAAILAGDAVVAKQGVPRGPISLKTAKAGFKAGQTVQITNATWGISAVTHPITQVDMSVPGGGKDLVYELTLDDTLVTMADVVASATQTATAANTVAQQVALTALDTTPPAVPTGLALSSDVYRQNTGATIVRLIATLTHPADSDYFGSYIEVTRDNDGNPTTPSPVWTQPLKLLLGKESTSVAFENVAGATQYWARAFSVDLNNNKSAYTSVVTHTTVKDTSAPAIPANLTAVAGFRGVGLSWNATVDTDIANYQYRYSTNGGTSWITTVSLKATKTFVDGLTPGVTYTFQVQAVDLSANVSGWSSSVTAVPNSIGTTDIAAGSITAAMIAASGISADSITAGKLTLKSSGGMTALEVYNGAALTGSWDPANGIKIYGANSGDYAVFNSGVLSFYSAGVLTAQLSPSGILADSIRFGTLPGGHNVIMNSSFELAAFVTAASSVLFTDATATPGWKAANRIIAPDNITEGTTLSSTLAF